MKMKKEMARPNVGAVAQMFINYLLFVCITADNRRSIHLWDV